MKENIHVLNISQKTCVQRLFLKILQLQNKTQTIKMSKILVANTSLKNIYERIVVIAKVYQYY